MNAGTTTRTMKVLAIGKGTLLVKQLVNGKAKRCALQGRPELT